MRNFLATLSPIPTSVRAERVHGLESQSQPSNRLFDFKKCKACSALCFKLLTPDHYQVRTISITITVIALLLILSRKSCTLIVELFISVEEQLLLKIYYTLKVDDFCFIFVQKNPRIKVPLKLFWGKIHCFFNNMVF